MKLFKNFYFPLCVILQIVFSSNTFSADRDKEIQNVTIQLKWKHQFQFAGYYAAIERGYFHDVGIHVNLVEFSENKDPNLAVFNGEADFGISSSDVLLLRSKHKNIVVLASIFQHSPLILLALEKSGIRHARDLIGKRIALEPNSAEIVAYLNSEGVSIGNCIVTNQTTDLTQLLNNKVDAMTGYSTDETFSLEEAGIGYTVISPLMGGFDFYGDVLYQ